VNAPNPVATLFGTVRPRVQIPGPRPSFEYELTRLNGCRQVGETGAYSRNCSQSFLVDYSQPAFGGLPFDFSGGS